MKRASSLLIVLIFIPMIISCAIVRVSHLKDGIDNFRGQNYRSAFILLKPEAQRGQAEAQYAVGYMYYYGLGVVEDRDKAWFWIHRAAGQGQPDAVIAVKILGQAPPVM